MPHAGTWTNLDILFFGCLAGSSPNAGQLRINTVRRADRGSDEPTGEGGSASYRLALPRQPDPNPAPSPSPVFPLFRNS